MTGVDYEVEYNNRARVPQSPALIAGWGRDAAAYRATHAPRSISYGSGARHVIDFFPGDGKGPIVVFIHGGYWQALDGSSFSHLARGLNGHGIGVAIPSYDLCPNVTVEEIIAQMRIASRELARLGSLWSSAAIPPEGIWRPACWRPIGGRSMHRCLPTS